MPEMAQRKRHSDRKPAAIVRKLHMQQELRQRSNGKTFPDSELGVPYCVYFNPTRIFARQATIGRSTQGVFGPW